ncbi:YkgJ family cysteine cluster protein [Archaeoglobus sp.]
MQVPWRRVASWHCNACGICCKVYRPKLTAYEYLKLKSTGFVEERAGRFYIRKINGLCPFQRGNLCSLQQNLKPLACKIFPFIVRRKGSEEALFELDGETYYVYADTFCPNLLVKSDLKPVDRVYELVKEAVLLFTGKREFKLLTAQLNQETAKLQQLHLRLAMA